MGSAENSGFHKQYLIKLRILKSEIKKWDFRRKEGTDIDESMGRELEK